MSRFLRAFLWLRWRLFVNALKGSRRRDALERASRLAAVVVPAFLVLGVLALAVTLAILGLACGWAVATERVGARGPLLALRLVLLIALGFLVVVPPGGASAAGATRLLLLPIRRAHLHAVEALSALADPRIAIVAPALFAFAAGLALGGSPRSAALALAAALGSTVFLVAFGTLAASLTAWLMKSRKRGELLALLGVLLVTFVSVLPVFFGEDVERSLRGAEDPLAGLDAALPAWTRALPSELHGRALLAGLEGDTLAGWIRGLLLGAEAALVWALSSAAHALLLGSSGGARARRKKDAVRASALRLPGLSETASAVALVQARNVLRSVRGKLVVLMPGPLMAIIGMISRSAPEEMPGGVLFGSEGYALFGAGCIFSLYTLLSFSANSLAADRAGLTLQFLLPLDEVDLVRGKTVGNAVLLAGCVLNCLVCALLVVPVKGSPFAWLAVLLATFATYLLLAPIAALLSALFPVASDLSKTGPGGNPHGLAFFLGTLLVLAFATPPGVVLVFGRERPGLALSLVALWTLFSAVVSIPLLGVAARAIAPRRENLALVAQGR